MEGIFMCVCVSACEILYVIRELNACRCRCCGLPRTQTVLTRFSFAPPTTRADITSVHRRANTRTHARELLVFLGVIVRLLVRLCSCAVKVLFLRPQRATTTPHTDTNTLKKDTDRLASVVCVLTRQQTRHCLSDLPPPPTHHRYIPSCRLRAKR